MNTFDLSYGLTHLKDDSDKLTRGAVASSFFFLVEGELRFQSAATSGFSQLSQTYLYISDYVI